MWEIIVNFERSKDMTEIIFIAEESPEGGYEAKALGHSIFTEGETIEELKKNIKEAIHCHFETDAPKIIRIHYIKEEIIAAWKKCQGTFPEHDPLKIGTLSSILKDIAAHFEISKEELIDQIF